MSHLPLRVRPTGGGCVSLIVRIKDATGLTREDLLRNLEPPRTHGSIPEAEGGNYTGPPVSPDRTSGEQESVNVLFHWKRNYFGPSFLFSFSTGSTEGTQPMLTRLGHTWTTGVGTATHEVSWSRRTEGTTTHPGDLATPSHGHIREAPEGR